MKQQHFSPSSGLPFGQLPLLEFDGAQIAQSMTIARFLAKKGGLAGRNELEQAQADMMVDNTIDIMGSKSCQRNCHLLFETIKFVAMCSQNMLANFSLGIGVP